MSLQDLQYTISMQAQPTETTCGPTCLHGLYQFHNLDADLHEVIDSIPTLPEGGTLGVHLANAALKNGFRVVIYTYNLHIFDPSWRNLDKDDLKSKLQQQAQRTLSAKKKSGSMGYVEFLEAGGNICFDELTPELLRQILQTSGPFICGLSATYLYQVKREIGDIGLDDDIVGDPQGHFVLATGVSGDLDKVLVADPYVKNPINGEIHYRVSMDRFLNSILLGVITYDANLIVLHKG